MVVLVFLPALAVVLVRLVLLLALAAVLAPLAFPLDLAVVVLVFLPALAVVLAPLVLLLALAAVLLHLALRAPAALPICLETMSTLISSSPLTLLPQAKPLELLSTVPLPTPSQLFSTSTSPNRMLARHAASSSSSLIWRILRLLRSPSAEMARSTSRASSRLLPKKPLLTTPLVSRRTWVNSPLRLATLTSSLLSSARLVRPSLMR